MKSIGTKSVLCWKMFLCLMVVLAMGVECGAQCTWPQIINSDSSRRWCTTNGEFLAAGNPGYSSSAGSVSIYRNIQNEWILSSFILSPDGPSANARFGESLELADDTLVISEWNANFGSGSIHIYELNEPGIFDHTFSYSHLSNLHLGRSSVQVSGNVVAASTSIGLIRIFRRGVSGWFNEATLNNPDAANEPGAIYGENIGLDGNLLACTNSTNHQCDIYEFDGAVWNLTLEDAELASSNVGAMDLFGNWIISGDWAFNQQRGRVQLLNYDPEFNQLNLVSSIESAVSNTRIGASVWIENDQLCYSNLDTAIFIHNYSAGGIGDVQNTIAGSFVRSTGANSADFSNGTAVMGVGTQAFQLDDVITRTIINNQSIDCNNNGIDDVCETSVNPASDCNSDNIPDSCQTGTYHYDSGELGTIEAPLTVSHTILSPPLNFGTDVSVSISAFADLNSTTEYLDVLLNGVPVGVVCSAETSATVCTNCNSTFFIDRFLFEDLVIQSGDATFDFIPSAEVGTCTNPNFSFSINYSIQTPEDCDADQILDSCEIASGAELDCDGDELPDSCVTASFDDTSPDLNPVGSTNVLEYTIPTPPQGSDVLFTITARGDLLGVTESLSLRLNGVPLGSVFVDDGNDCLSEISEEIEIPGTQWNYLINGGDAVLELVPTDDVDAAECSVGFSRIRTQYQQKTAADCDGNGIPDACDLVNGDLTDLDGDGTPDECEALGDCNGNGVPDGGDVNSGTSADCNGNGLPDECDIAVSALDCDGDAILDICQLDGRDCDRDGVLDSCAIASGATEDCDLNGTPDFCELSANDCNANGLLDSCEILTGTALDCDSNGVPDECLNAQVIRTGTMIGPVGWLAPVLQDLQGLPPAADNVTITIRAETDLGEVTEDAEVFINGLPVAILFAFTGGNCTPGGDQESIVVLREDFNALVPDGIATFDVSFSTSVDPLLCPNSSLTWTISYLGTYGVDQNNDGTPDACQPPALGDCDGDGVSDLGEIEAGTASDCNGNSIPDNCEIDQGSAQDVDEDGIPDECGIRFIRGECDSSVGITISDAITMLSYLFGGEAAPACADACDWNADDSLDISDPISTLQYLFTGGSSPAVPWPSCGYGTTIGNLGCSAFSQCP